MTHPLVRKVAFTGSTPIGERVAALAAKGSKRVTLELGGSDPMIICDDADLQAAASAAAWAASTTAARRAWRSSALYVFESVADEVIEAVAAKAQRLRVGIGSDPDEPDRARCTPSASATMLERQIAEMRAARSSRAAGGRTTRRWPPAGSTSRRSSWSPARTRRWRGRRSSGRRCRSGA